MLDLDAGLREILGTTPAKPPAHGAEPGPGDLRILHRETSAVLRAILIRRTNGTVRAALDLLAAARAGDLTRVSILSRALVDALAFDGADAITYARARALGGIDAGSLIDALAADLLGIDAFARAHPGADIDVDACELACRHARALAGTLARTRAGINALDRACAHADARVDAFARVLADAVNSTLTDADALADNLATALANALTGAVDPGGHLAAVRDHTAALVSSLLTLIDSILIRGLSWALAGVDLEHLTPERLGLLLDDVTHVDLSTLDLTGIDLTGIDLTGLRWSRTTQWPSRLFATIRQRSQETEPGSGVFKVLHDDEEIPCPQ